MATFSPRFVSTPRVKNQGKSAQTDAGFARAFTFKNYLQNCLVKEAAQLPQSALSAPDLILLLIFILNLPS